MHIYIILYITYINECKFLRDWKGNHIQLNNNFLVKIGQKIIFYTMLIKQIFMD